MFCVDCKENFPTKDFYFNKSLNKYYSCCKHCQSRRVKLTKNYNSKKYKQSPNGKKALYEAARKSYIRHKEKWLARAKARYAVKIGSITKPKRCEVCDKIEILQAHHEDHHKPLEIIFLCYSCHAIADKLLKIRSLKC